jgi:DNA-binding CsgD family transcriptional regulator
MATQANNFQEFAELLALQKFSEPELDYTVMNRHIEQLKKLSKMSNSSIMVVDLSKKTHVFSSGLYDFFVQETNKSHLFSESILGQRIHTSDATALAKLWATSLKFCFSLPQGERKQHKIIMDYRIRSPKGDYVRIIEQHQVLEMDKQGNVWLTISFVDISPDQDLESGLRYSIVNCKTGEMVGLSCTDDSMTPGKNAKLSTREKQILSLIKEGYISKEIACKLFLSVHTVNTHRQRILEKLNAATSIEAIRYASNLSLLPVKSRI